MKFVHTNIVAEDYRVLARFYQEVFQCRVKPPERQLMGEWLDSATGLSQAKLKGVHLILPGYGDGGPTLEIFSYNKMAEAGTATASTKGIGHIAFQVGDVRAVYDGALAAGASALGKISGKEIPGVGSLTFVYIRDPKGNIVEIQSWD